MQISGAPPVGEDLNPCVEGPTQTVLGGLPDTPVPETLTPDLAPAGDGPHTVTVTAYDLQGGESTSVSFDVQVDNTLPSPAEMVGPVGWQRGGEVITSTAVTSGPSGIAGQYCSSGSSPAGWYAGATAQLAVTGNGRVPVRCSAENNAGALGPMTEYDALLDDTPPTGYFAPRDPNDPALATVIAGDSMSGVAGGQIEVQTAGGWVPLATSYNATSGRLTAIVPDDGSLPDGNYALRAIVSDAVGNTATITTDQNGTPEIVTVPLRIVTRLALGRARPLVRRCSLSRIVTGQRSEVRKQRVAVRVVRRCSQVPGNGAGAGLRFGQRASVSGLVVTADGEPVAGALVQVSQQPAGWGSQPAGTVTSDSNGQFSYTIGAGPSRTITFAFPGSATVRPSAATTAVNVLGKAGIAVSRSVRAARAVRMRGTVLGGYIPTGGVLVQLQYQVSGLSLGWAPFHTPVRTDSHGRFNVTFRLPAGAAGYRYLFRALVAGQDSWPYRSALSNTIVRAVT